MPNAYKVLGQQAPAATTDTTLYTVPASTEAVVSLMKVANRGSTAATIRIAIRPDGASIANEHYTDYDVAVPANSSLELNQGVALDAADVVTVRASTANCTFQVFGVEIT